MLSLDQCDLPLGGVISQALSARSMIAHKTAARLGPGFLNRDDAFASRRTEVDGLDPTFGDESTTEISETHWAGFLLGLG